MDDEPIINRLALIGTGLIGGSIARAARASGAAKTIVATARSPETRQRIRELGFADQVTETNAEAVRDADLVIVSIPVGASETGRKEIAPEPEARRNPVGRRLGERLGRSRHVAVCAGWRALHSRSSGRRYGKLRPRRRLRGIVREPLVHPDAGTRARKHQPSKHCVPSGKKLAPMFR